MIPFRSHDVLVVTQGRLGDRCRALLEGARVTVTSISAGEPLPSFVKYAVVVLAADQPLPAAAEAIDRACWSAGVPWIGAVTLGHELRVGPAIVPGETPCHDCVSRRLRALSMNLETHAAVEAMARARRSGDWLRGALGSITEQAASIVVAEALALALRRDRMLPDDAEGSARLRLARFWEADAIFGVLRARLVARIGRCHTCVPASERMRGSAGLSGELRLARQTATLRDGAAR